MKVIEEFLFFSIGFAAKTTEKLTTVVQKLIEQNKLSETDGKLLVDEYAKKIKEQTDKFDHKMEDFIVNTMQKCTFVKQNDIDKVLSRIENIEEKLNNK